jgi:predicted dehydrogenase
MAKRDNPISRRGFLITTATAALASGCATQGGGPAAAPVEVAAPVPGAAPAPPPPVVAQKVAGVVRVAGVGVGGQGMSDLGELDGAPNAKIVALCDVDAQRLAKAQQRWPEALAFRDYREMLAQAGDQFDAVCVSTPDHMHVSAAVAAMEQAKHVYVQKPLAHNLAELRLLTSTAARTGAVTQMGTQIHSTSAYRTGAAMIRAGAIGRVKEVHAWVSRDWGRTTGRPEQADPVPDFLDWDLWLGVAQERPFVNGLYHPAEWRRWQDFGTGTLGDMGCHIFDPVFAALGLGAPRRIVSNGAQHPAETFTPATDVTLHFDATEFAAPGFTLRWTDGEHGVRPDPARAQLPKGEKLPGAGSYFLGEKGVMIMPHWNAPTFFRNGKPMEISIDTQPEGNHYAEWIAACRGECEASTHFGYSGPVTEAVLTGVVAGHFPGQTLAWDSAALRFDLEAANARVRRSYRDGWGLIGL